VILKVRTFKVQLEKILSQKVLLENNGPFESLPEAELNDRNGDEEILLEKPDEKPTEGHE
jgi:hypothetical protein